MGSRKLLMTTASISLIITIILLAFIIKPTNTKEVKKNLNINFENEIVCSTIASKINKTCNNNVLEISEDEINNYTDLTINGDISSLKGIENFKNLKSLKILNTINLLDITPISNLTNLESLEITSDNGTMLQLNDISSLTNLINLKNLNISNTSVYDINMLSNLNLTNIEITNTNIFDVDALISNNIQIKKEIDWDVNSIQTMDLVLTNLNKPSTYFIIEGPCSIGYNYNLIYLRYQNTDNSNKCFIKTPDNSLIVEYNLIIN